jgi:hypothetical protein
MGTQSVQKKGVLPWLVRCACRAGTRDFFSALAALVSPVQNIIFLIKYTAYFNSFVHIAQQLWQGAVLGRLSPRMCLWAW